MDLTKFAIITLLFTALLYAIFLVLGVGGIAKNRAAQGIDNDQKSAK